MNRRTAKSLLDAISACTEIEDPELADSIPDLAKIVGMRHVIAHGYRDIRLEIVWEVTVYRVPPLKRRLLQMIDQYESGN